MDLQEATMKAILEANELKEDCTQVSNVDAGKIDVFPTDDKKKKKTEAEDENSRWDKYLNDSIDVYDINAYIKKECGEEYQTYDYKSGAAIFVADNGKCIIVDNEAVGITLKDENDEFKLGLNNAPKEEVDENGNVRKSIPIFPEYAIKTNIKSIKESGLYKTSTFAEFFERRDYNTRCRENFDELMRTLAGLNILKTESVKTESIDKEKVMNMTYNELPDMCYGVELIDNSIIVIKKGQTGYFETDFPTPKNREEAEKLVNHMNEKMGVTPEQRMVMELRSMHGNWGDDELDEFLDPNITIAPSTSLDLGDGAGLGMLAGML